MVDWSQVIGEILTQILRIILPLSIALVIKWAAELYHKLRTEQPQWIPVLDYAARTAVFAAEQIYGAGRGSEKKRYAIEAVQNYLAEKGIKLNVDVINDAIEAEVYKYLRHEEQEPSEGEA